MRATFAEMLAEPDRRVAVAADELRQLRLALDERQVSEIAAVEIQEIEGIIDEDLAAPRFERRLQGGEARYPALLDHDLAVDQRRVGR